MLKPDWGGSELREQPSKHVIQKSHGTEHWNSVSRRQERAMSFPTDRLKLALLLKVVGRWWIGIEDKNALVVEREFRGLPFGVVRPDPGRCRMNPSLQEALKGAGQRLHRVDVERRVGGWWDVDDALPETVELEEELNFLGPL